MAENKIPGKYPALLLLAGLIGLPAGPALAEDTVYVGGVGEQVEINLDVLQSLGTVPTVPELLQNSIRNGNGSSAPLPLPGEVRAASGNPLPPPTRPAPTRRVTSAPAPAAPALRPAATPRPAASPAVKAPVVAPTRRVTVPVPQTPKVAAPVPSAPKVVTTPAPIVAPPATVAVTAPEPKAPKAVTQVPDVTAPAKTAARTIAPPPPPPTIAPPPAPTTAPAPIAKTPAPAAKKPAPVQTAAVSSNGADTSIGFEAGSKSLPASASGMLDQIADKMGKDETLRLQLLAYASKGDGSEGVARRLSLSRALQVRSYLIGKDIASTRMDVRALGDKAPGGNPDRVDISLVKR